MENKTLINPVARGKSNKPTPIFQKNNVDTPSP